MKPGFCSSALIGAAAAALFAASPAAAQTWTAQPASDAWDAAAVAQWDSGVAMVARCREGDFRLITQLVAPMEGMAATVDYAFDEGETQSELSGLSRSRQAVFARVPADFARELISARSLDMTVNDGETRPQRYILDAPGAPEVLGNVLTACGEPLVATPHPPGTVITNPDWTERPSGTDLAGFYPDRALQSNINGDATVQCMVTVEGRLEECLPLSEDPEGEGFGVATVAAAQHFRMTPALADGEPVGGSLVNITIRWRLDGSGSGPDHECHRGSGPEPCIQPDTPRD